MRFVRVLIIGSLCIGSVPMMTFAQSRSGIEIRDAAGPLEQQAKPTSATIAAPRRKTTKAPEYPWELRRIGARAAFIVQVTVDKSGRVVEARRAQGPLIQVAIGSPNDAASQKAAAEAIIRETSLALKDWRFDAPAPGPMTFQMSLAFVGGQVNTAQTDPAEVLPKEAAPAPWAAAQGALPTGQVKMPKQTKYVKPVYSKAALDARVQGTVQLELVIGPEGQVVDTRVLKSIPLLDQAAIEATLQARYEPIHVYGNPATVISVVTHTFSFKTKSE